LLYCKIDKLNNNVSLL